MGSDRHIITRLSIMMFLQFFVWGAFFVTLGSYLLSVFQGETGINSIIGQAYATHNWAALLAPLFVGLLADRYFNAERLNAFCQFAGAALLWYASTVTDPGTFIWVMFAYFMLYMPTLALANAIAFSNIDSPDRQFPAIRVWGTIGWIVSGFVVAQTVLGWVDIPFLQIITGVENAQASNVPLRMAAVISVLYGLYCLTLPATPPQARGERFSFSKSLGLDAIKLMAERNFFIFALSSFLISIPLSFYYARTNDFVAAMAFGDQSASFMAIGQMSEVLFMLLVPFFLIRFGIKWMLVVAMGAWALRYLVFASFPESAAFLIFGIALHGICYDFFFVTGQLYVDRKAPAPIRASAQGLFALLTYGAGMLVGNYMLGWWGDRISLDGSTMIGWQQSAFAFWVMPSLLALAILLFFVFTFKSEKNHDSVSQSA